MGQHVGFAPCLTHILPKLLTAKLLSSSDDGVGLTSSDRGVRRSNQSSSPPTSFLPLIGRGAPGASSWGVQREEPTERGTSGGRARTNSDSPPDDYDSRPSAQSNGDFGSAKKTTPQKKKSPGLSMPGAFSDSDW